MILLRMGTFCRMLLSEDENKSIIADVNTTFRWNPVHSVLTRGLKKYIRMKAITTLNVSSTAFKYSGALSQTPRRVMMYKNQNRSFP